MTERKQTSPDQEQHKEISTKLAEVFHLFEQNNIDARLVGSLGRAASLHTTNPTHTFADIDVVIMSGGEGENFEAVFNKAKKLAQPLVLEEHFKNQIIISGESAHIRYKNISHTVSPHIFDKKVGTLFGQPVPTFDPKTLFYLTALYGYMRPKDWQQIRQFRRELNSHVSELPENVFEPFHQLLKDQRIYYPNETLLGELRWVYHTRVPQTIRKAFSGVTEPLWKVLKS